MTPLAEKVHARFRGSSELSKLMRLAALLVDVVAATFACLGIFGTLKSPWVPLSLLVLAVVAALLRGLADAIRSFAQRCRRSSLRALCFDVDIDRVTESNTAVDAPLGTAWLANRTPPHSLAEYYEPTCPPGENRLRELYAHSAFYTWRLLRAYARIAAFWAAIVFAVSFVVIYGLATTTVTPASRDAVLEALCTVILVILCVRAFETATAAKASSNEARSIEEALLKKPIGQQLVEIVDAYDIERAAGPDVPTTLYRVMRNRLQTQWHERRLAIVDC
jgi:hypothetical protein